jgi:hypothetical protein
LKPPAAILTFLNNNIIVIIFLRSVISYKLTKPAIQAGFWFIRENEGFRGLVGRRYEPRMGCLAA